MTRQMTRTANPVTCDPRTSVTKSLLGYGVIAGPVYIVVSLAQALTRDGFDLARHQWSMLANGELGWIQITNFFVAGLMTLACAVGLHRALPPGRGAIWANLSFITGIVIIWTWLSALSLHLCRHTTPEQA
ncbi:DUF998 domain-containing protein [Sphaerisporangium sp. NPDC088356]|uniref:DUF998 domain-containing protein n=1 Tax=Sphaerisporangium sp. NPDC088356 TaxID=3154871 RepID=UPI00342E2B9B